MNDQRHRNRSKCYDGKEVPEPELKFPDFGELKLISNHPKPSQPIDPPAQLLGRLVPSFSLVAIHQRRDRQTNRHLCTDPDCEAQHHPQRFIIHGNLPQCDKRTREKRTR
jgi:hypothetical protein